MSSCSEYGRRANGHSMRRHTVHFTPGLAQFALGQYEPAPAVGARFNYEVGDVDAWWAGSVRAPK